MRDPLPGGVGISRLCVYDTGGGSPHLHLCCTEAYVVTGGDGAVQTLSGQGFAEYELHAGTVVWFTPGTVHRLVNHGDLDIVVVMSNSGLPEAGDAVLTFPPAVLADPDRYAAAADLPIGADLAAAHQRRDLAVDGFHLLCAAVDRDGPRAMRDFHATAAALKRPLLDQWRNRWEDGAFRAAQSTGVHLDALARGDASYLTDSRVSALPRPAEEGRLGMCGLLNTYPPTP